MSTSNAISLRQAPLPEWSSLLKEYIILRRAEGASAGTITIYEGYVRRFFQAYPDALSSPDRLKDCVYDHLGAEHLQPVTYNMRFRFLRVFLEFLRTEGFIPENPASKFKTRKEPGRAVSVKPEVIQRLLDAPRKDTFAGMRDKVMMIITLDTGLRPQEARKLYAEDVDLEEGCIRIRPEVAKTKEARTLPLSDISLAEIRKYLSIRPPEWSKSPLFPTETGTPMTAGTITGRMFHYRQIAGIETFPWYALRHTFATTMIRSGASLDSVRQILGHANFSIVKTYLHLTNDDVKREHEAHSPLLSLLPQPTKRVRSIKA